MIRKKIEVEDENEGRKKKGVRWDTTLNGLRVVRKVLRGV